MISTKIKIFSPGICQLHKASSKHLINYLFQQKRTTFHTEQTSETIHNFHVSAIDIYQVYKHGALPHQSFPYQQLTILQLDNIPVRIFDWRSRAVEVVALPEDPNCELCYPDLLSIIQLHQRRYLYKKHHPYDPGIVGLRSGCEDPIRLCFHQNSTKNKPREKKSHIISPKTN